MPLVLWDHSDEKFGARLIRRTLTLWCNDAPCPYRAAKQRHMPNRATAQPRRNRRPICASHAQRAAHRLRAVVAHLQEKQEADFHRIVHVLHDEILSRLVRVRMDLAEACCHSRRARVGRTSSWANATQGIREAITIAARVRAELRPPLLEHCGLEAAIGAVAGMWEKHHGWRCRFTASTGGLRIRPSLVLELFRLFEEGLRSLTENCGPAHVAVEYAQTQQFHRLCLRMDIRSADASRRLVTSSALLAVRERARRIGGKLVVRRTSAPSISLMIIIPVQA